MKIGSKIKELRKKRGITQEQFANIIGVSFQAVSKWENEITLPDIAIIPSIAGYFGVTMDELFDYNVQQIEENALKIAKETWPLRESDPEKGKQIIYEGLKKYPENDILLVNLLYLINYNEYPNETIDVALRTIDATKDNSTKYDALRFLAYAYKAKGDLQSAKSALLQIPELYFTRLSEMAYVLTGEEKRMAAEKQRGISIGIVCEMQARISEDMVEKGQKEEAKREYEKALKLLDLFEANESGWTAYRDFLKTKIEKES